MSWFDDDKELKASIKEIKGMVEKLVGHPIENSPVHPSCPQMSEIMEIQSKIRELYRDKIDNQTMNKADWEGYGQLSKHLCRPRIGFINGERVYYRLKSTESERVYITRHNDVVKFVEKAFENPTSKHMDKLLHGLKRLSLYGNEAIIQSEEGIDVQEVEINKVVFDNANMPKKRALKHVKAKEARRLSVIKGGSYKAPEPKITHSILSDNGKAWINKQSSDEGRPGELEKS